MKKKPNLTYVGEVDVTSYGFYICDQRLDTIISDSMREGKEGEEFLARVTLTIEPLEDAGLRVEVE